MFGLDEKIKNAAAAGGAMALAASVAILGVVWLSIAAVTALTRVTSPVAAMCLVGAVALLPLIITLARQKPARAAAQPEPQQTAEDTAAIVRLAHSAHLMAERAPAAGIALTLGAAFLAARSPATSPLAMHMLAEAVERWLSTRPAREANGDARDAHETFTDPR